MSFYQKHLKYKITSFQNSNIQKNIPKLNTACYTLKCFSSFSVYSFDRNHLVKNSKAASWYAVNASDMFPGMLLRNFFWTMLMHIFNGADVV